MGKNFLQYKRKKYYNADGAEHSDQSKAYRGNYAGIGYTWDEDNDIFWYNNHTQVGLKTQLLLRGTHQSLILQ